MSTQIFVTKILFAGLEEDQMVLRRAVRQPSKADRAASRPDRIEEKADLAAAPRNGFTSESRQKVEIVPILGAARTNLTCWRLAAEQSVRRS